MKLLSNRVLVKLAPTPERVNGLIHADSIPDPPSLGKVVQVGPRCASVAPGQLVVMAPEAIAEDVTGIDGLRVPHVIVRETELELRMEAE